MSYLTQYGLHKSHPFYIAWKGLRNRCNNPKCTQYPWYGAIGVECCSEWNSFDTFFNDMFSTWGSGLSIDRIDSNGHYNKENCRWIAIKENSRYKSTTKLNQEKVNGIRKLYAAGVLQRVLAKDYNVTQATISYIVTGKGWND